MKFGDGFKGMCENHTDMPSNTNPDTRHLKSVNRAFDIIDYLRENGPTTLSELADDIGLPMSTAHIHLSTLIESEYVVKDDNKYRCSLMFLKTGGEVRSRIPLYQAAKTEVVDLQQDLGEHANIAIEENDHLVQLFKSENPGSIDDSASQGAHLNLHGTATGKAILSQRSHSEVDAFIERHGLPELTENTITKREELHEELEEIRERGYSINQAEHHRGVTAVAVPIILNSDDVVGAISISGPLSRFPKERIDDELAPALLGKKNIIELKLASN